MWARLLAIVLLLLLPLWFLFPHGGMGQVEQAVSRAEQPDLEEAVARIVQLTNDFRQKEGRAPVKVDAKLQETARYFARFMAEHDKYGHNADDSEPSERAKKRGYDYCLVSENIAYIWRPSGFSTEELARRLTQGWIDSPHHRDNMLDPDVTDTGVAVARSEKSGYFYGVQMFGRPRSQAITFRISNSTDATIRYEVDEQSFELQPYYIRTHTVCRPTAVKLYWPNEAGEFAKVPATTIRPQDGDHVVIHRQGADFAVRKE